MGLAASIQSSAGLRMPDFVSSAAGFAHTVDSAMLALEHLGVPDARMHIRMAGPGRPGLQVVRQSPAPGAALTSTTRVVLTIAGFGFFHSLPVPMREAGGEREMGTYELCSLFDNPLQKAARWFRVGAPLFAIAPHRPAACRRWLALFGLDSTPWPERLLFPLALLAPALARLAGRHAGVALTMQLLFGLPLLALEPYASWQHLTAAQHSRLGTRASRLGHDLLTGDRQRGVDGLRVRLGPVPLATYQQFNTAEGRRLLGLACELCLSAFHPYTFSWSVGDRNARPTLGSADNNGTLGVNFHLGRGVMA